MSNDVAKWLEQLGLSRYSAVFAENAIEWDILPELDQETLKDIGIARAGDRLRLIKAARALLAVIKLSRLWADQGRRDDAYGLLSPLYEWFTEGFDTADLKDAKALLDGLR